MSGTSVRVSQAQQHQTRWFLPRWHHPCRRALLLGRTLLLGSWLLLSSQLPGHRVGVAQRPEPAAPAPMLEADADAPPLLTLTIPRELLQALDEADACLGRQDEAGAVRTLQTLLETPEDFFLDRTRQSSLKQTTRERLQKLSDVGRQQYELLYGSQAQRRLEEALAAQNEIELAEIARLYPIASAGLKAAYLLASKALDRGEYQSAVIQFAQLQSAAPALIRQWEPALTLKQILALDRSGQPEQAEQLLDQFRLQTPAPQVVLKGAPPIRLRTTGTAREVLEQLFGSAVSGTTSVATTSDWAQPRGGPSRNLASLAATPVGGQVWTLPAQEMEHVDFSPASEAASHEAVIAQVEELVRAAKEVGRAEFSTAQPLVIGSVVILRTWNHLIAVSLKTGQVLWRSVLTDSTLERLRNTFAKSQGGLVNGPLRVYLQQRLFSDLTAGRLATDGERVYAVETYPSSGLSFGRNAFNRNLLDLGVESPDNRLVAYSLVGGKLLWELGGPRTQQPLPLAGHTFLGPPLVADGLLYCLTENGGEVRLMVLRPSSSAAELQVVWTQSLAAAEMQLPDALPSGQKGLSPSLASGVLVCPTGTGLLVAIDVARRSLLWSTAYRPPTLLNEQQLQLAMIGRSRGGQNNQGDDVAPRWTDGLALVEGDSLLLPAETDELLCVDLATGSLRWRRPRGQGLYLAAIHSGSAVIVERGQVKALSVATGEPAWKEPVPIPVPSGTGLLVGERYLLPLGTGELATLDLATGRLLARSKLRDGVIPGNLAAGDSTLVTQSALNVCAFRSQPEVEEQITTNLSANPQDAPALALRGELRLHAGQEDEGLADLREAIRLQPNPYAQAVLAGTLLDLLRTSPQRLAEARADLEPLLTDPQQRQEFLLLSARALEQQQDRVGALTQYLKLVVGAARDFPLETLSLDWTVRTDRLLCSTLSRLTAQAPPAEQAQLTALISDFAARELQGDNTVENLCQFIRLFGNDASATAIRDQLYGELPLERLGELEQLVLGRYEQTGGTLDAAGLEAWATRLFEAGRNQELRELLDWAGAPLTPAVSSQPTAEIAAIIARWNARPEIAALAHQPETWPAGEIDVRRTTRPEVVTSRIVPLAVASQRGPFYRGWSFEVDTSTNKLIARDGQLNERWQFSLPSEGDRPGILAGLQLSGTYEVHVCGHVIGLSLITRMVLLDGLTPVGKPPRVLWQKSLQNSPASTPVPVIFGAARWIGPNGRRRISLNDQFGNPLGRLHVVTPKGVIYQTGNRLIAADVLTGHILWSRAIAGQKFNGRASSEWLVTTDNSGQLYPYRLLDGELLATRKPAGPQEGIQLLNGAELLEMERVIEPDRAPIHLLRLTDLVTGKQVWQQEFRREPVFSPLLAEVEPDRIAILEGTGHLTLLERSSGEVVLEVELPRLQPQESGLFNVTRFRDSYLVLLPGSVPASGQSSFRAYQLDAEHALFEGHLISIAAETGAVRWKTPIPPTSLNTQQPANWPVMVFASRLHGVAVQPNGVQLAVNQLGVMLVDKGTGQLLYSTEEGGAVPNYEVLPFPEEHRLQFSLGNWSVNLSYPQN